MNARPLNNPIGGLLVSHEDISGILRAGRNRTVPRSVLTENLPHDADQIADSHEQLGQNLTAISLAAVALRKGGNVGDAVNLIGLAVEEAHLELTKLRCGPDSDAG